jgi:hypothetical protein
MPLEWRECPNCGGSLESAESVCYRCGEERSLYGSGHPRFTLEARRVPLELGGLLKLFPANGAVVRHVGWCPAGVVGIDAFGALIWQLDLGYVGSIEVEGGTVRIDERPYDVDSGRPSA